MAGNVATSLIWRSELLRDEPSLDTSKQCSHASRSACVLYLEGAAPGIERGCLFWQVGNSRYDENRAVLAQTLNALLVEMDGFAKNQGVIVIAATNQVGVTRRDAPHDDPPSRIPTQPACPPCYLSSYLPTYRLAFFSSS